MGQRFRERSRRVSATWRLRPGPPRRRQQARRPPIARATKEAAIPRHTRTPSRRRRRPSVAPTSRPTALVVNRDAVAAMRSGYRVVHVQGATPVYRYTDA
ncbi:hypothetical protein KRM28CT15_02560 [Krasilnikovia sp. M28-CT-15]